MEDKKAYTPEEFASLFGHEKTWSYRLVWAGKISPWPEGYGKMMIPASEVARLEAMGERYNGKKKKVAATKAGPKLTKKETAKKNLEAKAVSQNKKLPTPKTGWIHSAFKPAKRGNGRDGSSGNLSKVFKDSNRN
jgi:hypothetical protein